MSGNDDQKGGKGAAPKGQQQFRAPNPGFGNPPTGQMPTQPGGFQNPPTGQFPAQNQFSNPPTGQMPAGNPGFGNPPTGQMPAGNPGFGNPPTAQIPVGNPGFGNPPTAQIPVGNPGFGNPPTAQIPVGNPGFGNPPTAQMHTAGYGAFDEDFDSEPTPPAGTFQPGGPGQYQTGSTPAVGSPGSFNAPFGNPPTGAFTAHPSQSPGATPIPGQFKAAGGFATGAFKPDAGAVVTAKMRAIYGAGGFASGALAGLLLGIVNSALEGVDLLSGLGVTFQIGGWFAILFGVACALKPERVESMLRQWEIIE